MFGSKKKEATTEDKIAAVAVVLIGLGAVIYFNFFDTTPSKPADDSQMAFIECQHFVEDRLKAPSGAEFSSGFHGGLVAANTYAIQSYVDAQNSFGAKLRNNFICQVNYKGGDIGDRANWQLQDLRFFE